MLPIFEALEPRTLLDSAPFPDLALLQDRNDPVVRLETTYGAIDIELLPGSAPRTAAHVLEQVNTGCYSETMFHRVDAGRFLQGGSYSYVSGEPGGVGGLRLIGQGPVPDEAFRPTTPRLVALGGLPDGQLDIMSGLIFNLDEDLPQAGWPQGAVVFARVIDDASWNVVLTIAGRPTADLNANPGFTLGPGFSPGDFTSTPVTATYATGAPVHENDVVQIGEARVVKPAGEFDYYRSTIYYPEGFAGSTISEFVPIVNPNGQFIAYQLLARFETGLESGARRDVVINASTLAPSSRGGDTVSTIGDQPGSRVDIGRGYALELRSTLPVAANFSHYDFGAATGEAFSGATSASWYFANVRKAADGSVHDFLIWQNTGDLDAAVTLTFYGDSGAPIGTGSIATRAHRRGGFSVADTAFVPAGTYSVALRSDRPLTAALSHYDTSGVAGRRGATTEPGQTTPGTTGVVPFADSAEPGSATLAFLTFFNPSEGLVTVDIDPGPGGPNSPTSITVGPLTRVTLGIPANRSGAAALRGAIIYRSSAPVYAGFEQARAEDEYATAPLAVAARTIHFAEGFTDPARVAPNVLEETLGLYNPNHPRFGLAPRAAEVRLIFRYGDASATFTRTLTLAPNAAVDLRISDLTEVTDFANRLGLFFYAIEVSSDVPITALFRHTDASLGGVTSTGGFATTGTLFGPLTMLT